MAILYILMSLWFESRKPPLPTLWPREVFPENPCPFCKGRTGHAKCCAVPVWAEQL